ncbi:MAG: type II secretion system protein J [Planctomycetota bacterium]
MRAPANHPQQGLTLIELLVALTIFLFLGGALVMFLRVGIDTWRVGEVRREAYERAQAVIDELVDDLSCTFSDPSKGTGGVVDVLLLSDYDPNGRQRLRFVRTLAGEMRHPITQRAGALTGAQFDYDYVDDARESAQGLLRAPGGLQEIAYVMDCDPTVDMLWKGLKSPIGGAGTLFDDLSIYDVTGDVTAMTRRVRPFVDGVMYLEFNFWADATVTWASDDPGLNGPQSWWDSTRGILDPPATGRAATGHDPTSRHEWRDDVFPSRVQVVLVLRPARAVRFATLKSALGASDTRIRVNNTSGYPDGAFQYLKIGQEWIRYGKLTKSEFTELERGVRGTTATEHPVGTAVYYGTTFTRVVRIPSARHSTWGER